MKIGQYLAKIWTRVYCAVFFVVFVAVPLLVNKASCVWYVHVYGQVINGIRLVRTLQRIVQSNGHSVAVHISCDERLSRACIRDTLSIGVSSRRSMLPDKNVRYRLIGQKT